MLHMANRDMFFSESEGSFKRLKYKVHRCILSYVNISSDHASNYCNTLQNVTNLLKHRLLHYAGVGGKCRDINCNKNGTMDRSVLNRLNEKISNCTLWESICEMKLLKISNDVSGNICDESLGIIGESNINDRILNSTYRYKVNDGSGSSDDSLPTKLAMLSDSSTVVSENVTIRKVDSTTVITSQSETGLGATLLDMVNAVNPMPEQSHIKSNSHKYQNAF